MKLALAACLSALLLHAEAFSLASVRPRAPGRASLRCSLEPFSEEQKASLSEAKAKAFPEDPEQTVYNTGSPFVWSKIRLDYPDLKEFNDEQLTEGMRALGWVEGMAPLEAVEEFEATMEQTLEAKFYKAFLPIAGLIAIATVAEGFLPKSS